MSSISEVYDDNGDGGDGNEDSALLVSWFLGGVINCFSLTCKTSDGQSDLLPWAREYGQRAVDSSSLVVEAVV